MRLKTLALLGAVLLVLPSFAFAATENITHKTMIGEVTSFDGERLVLQTDDGTFYFDFEADTLVPETLNEGDLAAVDFELGTERDGIFIAQTVRIGEDVERLVASRTETDTVVAAPVVADVPEPRPTLPLAPAPAPEVDIETPDTVVADLDTGDVDLDTRVPQVETTTRSTLPATGSSLPLLGLGGLLALIGAGVLRFMA